jgi:hypothetical protein
LFWVTIFVSIHTHYVMVMQETHQAWLTSQEILVSLGATFVVTLLCIPIEDH